MNCLVVPQSQPRPNLIRAANLSTRMMKTIPLFAVVLTAFSMAACDSSQENARENTLEKQADTMENQAEATRQSAEAKADGIESAGKQGADKLNPATPADQAADAVRKDGEAKADGLENQAEAAREQK